jgi:hypothetical protein
MTVLVTVLATPVVLLQCKTVFNRNSAQQLQQCPTEASNNHNDSAASNQTTATNRNNI